MKTVIKRGCRILLLNVKKIFARKRTIKEPRLKYDPTSVDWAIL